MQEKYNFLLTLKKNYDTVCLLYLFSNNKVMNIIYFISLKTKTNFKY